jgi:hypothetical protein
LQKIGSRRLVYASIRGDTHGSLALVLAGLGPAGLWRYHALLGVTSGLAVASVQSSGLGWSQLAIDVVVCTAFCTALLSLYPQLMFKPQVRWLELDETGCRTVINSRHAVRPWSEIRSVDDDGDTVILTGRQNSAMLIPRRAFAGGPDRAQFVADITRWHAEAAARGR